MLKKEKELDEELLKIQLNRMHPAFNCDGMPKGNNKTELSNYAAILDEKERERKKVIAEKNKCYSNSKVKINLLTDEDEKQILLARYHFGLGWKEIASGMNKNIRRIYVLHENALRKFKMEDKQ